MQNAVVLWGLLVILQKYKVDGSLLYRIGQDFMDIPLTF